MSKSKLIFLAVLFSSAHADPWSTKFSTTYYGRMGNLDYHYYKGSVSFLKIGDIQLGDFVLTDTEFLLSFNRAKSTYNKNPYENDAGAILKVDLFANQTFSPFIFTEWKYDSLYALENRTNIGVGSKYRLNPNLSISYAALFESEKYTTDEKASTLYRHSLRPKFKRYFEDKGLYIDWQIFYKPRFDNTRKYLLENIINASFNIFGEILTLDLSYEYEFNSKYKIDRVVKSYAYDIDDSLGYYFADEYQDLYGMDIPFSYITDEDGYVMVPNVFFKPEDHTISIGVTFKF